MVRGAYSENRELEHGETGVVAGGCGGVAGSRDPGTGKLRFLEVKGRVSGADTITVTKNEILTSFNLPEDFILAMVEYMDGETHRVHYLRRPFERSGVTTDFNGASVNFPFSDLLARAGAPR
jgi:hypothetical protein